MYLERLCDIFFEFSNEDRLEILHRLNENHMNVTSLARGLDLSTQECSRHLARLVDAYLAKKNPDGLYGLTHYGLLFLRLVPSLDFIAKHRDYFLTHSLEKTPSDFVYRIGELQDSDVTQNVMVTNHIVESIIKKAEEYVWMIHDQYFLNLLPLLLDALRRGVKIRTFEPLTRDPEKRLDPMRPAYIEEKDEIYFMKAWQKGQVSTRFSDDINLYLYVSEKEAILAFPSYKGGFDYLGFYSTNPTMLGYCRDFFDYFFEKGVPLTQERGDRIHELRKKFYREREQTKTL